MPDPLERAQPDPPPEALRAKRLAGKVALITGAGRGIGRGMALAMAREGADIAVVERDAEGAASSAAAVRALGQRAAAICCDLSERAACESALRDAVAELGGVDILVNNAMASVQAPLLELRDEDFENAWAIGTLAPFWMMQAVHPLFLARGGGRIINFGSASGTLGKETQGAYGSAKEGARALAKVAALEWARDGITVNTICPFAASEGVVEYASQLPGGLEEFGKTVPIGRLGDPEHDIGRAAAFLASDDAAYITGQTLFVDGGGGTWR